MERLFGTDGVRALANTELTPELATAICRAATQLLGQSHPGAAVLVARDTRRSGDMLEAAAVAGICSAGADAVICGVAPTPALAVLVHALGAAAGVMVSASHNGCEYNGLKFFDRAGDKLNHSQEAAIESLALERSYRALSGSVGRVRRARRALSCYRKRLRRLVPGRPLQGMRLVLDCANGAMSWTAPAILSELGAEVIELNCSPDGDNINQGDTSRPKELAQAVLSHAADAGLAFDGDGDRLVMVDGDGGSVDGDQILAVWARHLVLRGELPNGLVVGTVLTNGGVERYLGSLGCRLVRSRVGDRHIAADMRRLGAALGGEGCGHTIYSPHLSSSDGLFTALAVLSIMAESRTPLAALVSSVPRIPQCSLSIPVPNRTDWLAHPEIHAAVAEAQAALHGWGRLIVRPSGTEPVIRVTCECDDARRAEATAREIASVIGSCVREKQSVHAHIAA